MECALVYLGSNLSGPPIIWWPPGPPNELFIGCPWWWLWNDPDGFINGGPKLLGPPGPNWGGNCGAGPELPGLPNCGPLLEGEPKGTFPVGPLNGGCEFCCGGGNPDEGGPGVDDPDGAGDAVYCGVFDPGGAWKLFGCILPAGEPWLGGKTPGPPKLFPLFPPAPPKLFPAPPPCGSPPFPFQLLGPVSSMLSGGPDDDTPRRDMPKNMQKEKNTFFMLENLMESFKKVMYKHSYVWNYSSHSIVCT